ncbi:TerB family tellurite resistance protein [Jannaschia sp. 2305UL9-9]|uniref:tellurite resistance TerB family protein n=1 Tax=Jannaschia sp. 2305UL9-9 TaxID=3121638 RepID=UPI0035299132
MFADLLRRLAAPAPDRLPEPDARLALAALMVRVARSDGDYAPAEVARIDRILMRRHGLDAAAAANLRLQAEGLEAEAPDTVRFTRAIKDAVSLEDRVAVIEALWSVVLADGERDAEEDSLLRLLANLLGVNDRDSNLARRRVETGG